MELMETFCNCLPQTESCPQPIKQAVKVYQWRLKETSGFQTKLRLTDIKKISKISGVKEKGRNAIVSTYAASFSEIFQVTVVDWTVKG